ncbi:MAG: DNA double-strand break repair nuclease NurA [Thermoproteota archaeon]|jgi:hypothetical protein|nr:DNA double-strand break repair nuclease NurA [Thermoproteota archaeon]
MKYQDISELIKRIEFNLTEPQVLVKLINDARLKGEKLQKDMGRFWRIAEEIANILEEREFILLRNNLDQIKLHNNYIVGIDGSYQLEGGFGGKWFAPISIARILFENEMSEQLKVRVDFWAWIEEIDETDHSIPENVARLKMLYGESTAILDWGNSKLPSFVFIDGPIADPPVLNIGGTVYINFRCDGLKRCLEKSTIVGCVKRSRDKFYIKYLEEVLCDTSEKDNLSQFLTDQYLMLNIFAHIRKTKNHFGPVFTKWIDISSVNETYESYKKNDIHIICLFFQKNMYSPVIRLDIPLLNSPNSNPEKTNEIVLQAIKAVDSWTYPGQDYPLPIILAHDKCNIRKGCAEILYEEIITRSRSADPITQLILTQLR